MKKIHIPDWPKFYDLILEFGVIFLVLSVFLPSYNLTGEVEALFENIKKFDIMEVASFFISSFSLVKCCLVSALEGKLTSFCIIITACILLIFIFFLADFPLVTLVINVVSTVCYILFIAQADFKLNGYEYGVGFYIFVVGTVLVYIGAILAVLNYKLNNYKWKE